MVVERLSFEEIELALQMIRDKAPYYRQYIDYYEGRHNLAFATIKWRQAFSGLFRQFADNLCAPIVDAPADRLRVTGFSVETAPDTDSQLLQIWRSNRMERKAGAVHEHALKVGDAYVIVWPDPRTGNPSIQPNPAHQMCVYYDDDGETILWAAKLWRIENSGNASRGWMWRLNLYYPNSIEKYISTARQYNAPTRAGSFQPYLVPSETWPLANPYSQVPVFHFANKAEMGIWGQSELWNILPLQDALNKSIADMIVAMEYVSLPQRWATGLEVEEDEKGNPIVPLVAAVNRVWNNPDPEGRWGQFPEANLTQFSQVQNDYRLEMSRISRTPLHYLSLGGNAQSAFVSSLYPSGESLRVAEAPFVAKLQERQISFGDVWEDLMAFALKISGGGEISPNDIETLWESAAPRSETDDLNNAIRKYTELGIPLDIILSELGYSEERIAFIKENQATLRPPVQARNDNNGQEVDREGDQTSGRVLSQG